MIVCRLLIDVGFKGFMCSFVCAAYMSSITVFRDNEGLTPEALPVRTDFQLSGSEATAVAKLNNPCCEQRCNIMEIAMYDSL